MTLFEEKQMRIEAATIGAQIVLKRLGLIKDEISQAEAFREFGMARVKSWLNQGLISRIKMGDRNSKATYSRIELETIQNIEKQRKLKT